MMIVKAISFTVLSLLSGVAQANGPPGKVVIANRGSGTISIIDAQSHTLVSTETMPNNGEPMYVVYSKISDKVFVGDRANNCVVVFNPDDYSIADPCIPAGNGVFHMWADSAGEQLWVNNDVDNTVTVIDPVNLVVITTVLLPADLIADGYKPHDVVLDGPGSAYVSFIGAANAFDYVVQYDTNSFGEVSRAQVGKDPHVSVTPTNDYLYIPAQNSNVVMILERDGLALVDTLDIPAAHGAGMTVSGKTFYTTNIAGGGPDGLYAIDTTTNTILGSADTPYPIPHNIVHTMNNAIFLTHSGGAADKVTIYTVTEAAPVPFYLAEVTVGLNPFGLAYVPSVDSTAMGDPHFKTWSGQWYDFHGICDLVYVSSPDFANGLGLDIHIRTKARYEYSYIEAAAIQIGEDVLEVGSWGDYSFNGVQGAQLPLAMGNGAFEVTMEETSNKKHKQLVIQADSNAKEVIVVGSFKDMVSVAVYNATHANFGTSVGMMGTFGNGDLVARDRVSNLRNDLDAFGQEWQVLASEPQLFQSASPYLGASCVPPMVADGRRRRLGEAKVSEKAAEMACAGFQGDAKERCILDVVAMDDLEVAEVHGAF